jgi:(p)ppGpp synthase/HD superfamily hydrolase
MYKLMKIDLLDAFIYADVFDEQAYTLIKESENLEEILGLAIEEFKAINPSYKTYQNWAEGAEDGGYEVEIFGDKYKSLFRGSMILLPRVEIAVRMAHKHHLGQKRKGDGKQYIIHILEISKLLFRNGGSEIDPEIIAASLCHDLLEDTDCPESEIEESFGPEVLRIVKAVTNDEKLESKKDWERKKTKYIESVRNGGEKAMIVCLADKIVNLRSLLKEYNKVGETIWERFNRGKEKKLWFEHSVLEMLKENLDHPLMNLYEKFIKDLESK